MNRINFQSFFLLILSIFIFKVLYFVCNDIIGLFNNLNSFLKILFGLVPFLIFVIIFVYERHNKISILENVIYFFICFSIGSLFSILFEITYLTNIEPDLIPERAKILAQIEIQKLEEIEVDKNADFNIDKKEIYDKYLEKFNPKNKLISFLKSLHLLVIPSLLLSFILKGFQNEKDK